jgi:hypothetical protein
LVVVLVVVVLVLVALLAPLVVVAVLLLLATRPLAIVVRSGGMLAINASVRSKEHARLIVVGIALLWVALGRRMGVVVVLPILFVVVVRVLALRRRILAVAVIVMASRRMSGHRGE